MEYMQRHRVSVFSLIIRIVQNIGICISQCQLHNISLLRQNVVPENSNFSSNLKNDSASFFNNKSYINYYVSAFSWLPRSTRQDFMAVMETSQLHNGHVSLFFPWIYKMILSFFKLMYYFLHNVFSDYLY